MKLIELIKTTPTDEIIAECVRIDSKNGDVPYRKTLDRLSQVKPVPADFAIILSSWEDKDDDYGAILNVYGTKDGDHDHYGMEFTPWAEWLDAEVRVAGVDVTSAQMVAQCLHEMTFISFDPED